MEFKFKKHVKIVVDLEIGERVIVDGFGYKLDGERTITDLKLHENCQSGVMAMVDGYTNWIDIAWLNKKIDPKNPGNGQI